MAYAIYGKQLVRQKERGTGVGMMLAVPHTGGEEMTLGNNNNVPGGPTTNKDSEQDKSKKMKNKSDKYFIYENGGFKKTKWTPEAVKNLAEQLEAKEKEIQDMKELLVVLEEQEEQKRQKKEERIKKAEQMKNAFVLKYKAMSTGTQPFTPLNTELGVVAFPPPHSGSRIADFTPSDEPNYNNSTDHKNYTHKGDKDKEKEKEKETENGETTPRGGGKKATGLELFSATAASMPQKLMKVVSIKPKATSASSSTHENPEQKRQKERDQMMHDLDLLFPGAEEDDQSV